MLDYFSKKSKRAVQSNMGGELYAFTDAFGVFMTIAIDPSRAFGREILIRIFTDSKKVFKIITRGKRPTEKCLAINVISVR